MLLRRLADFYSNPCARFPGQWFQIESDLAYNWHRHYDPTIGRYLQPDPLLSDETGPTVNGLPSSTLAASYGSDGRAVAKSMGWKEAHDIIMGWAPARPMLQDGPSVYGYAHSNPMARFDPRGLTTPRAGEPWGMEQVGKNRWRFFDGNGCADFDIELPGDHTLGPAWHGWSDGTRGPEMPF